MNPRKIRRYGWKPQLPDPRDHKLRFSYSADQIPISADLRSTGYLQPVYDQGDLGSCTSNAICAAVAYEHGRVSGSPSTTMLSRLFLYANERIIEGTPLSDDSGAQIRDGVKSAAVTGICPESLWPYDDSSLSITPPQICYDQAKQEVALEYCAVDEPGIMPAIAAGFPVVVGISVFDSFESDAVAKSGIVPMPASSESCVGGHAVLIVGYDRSANEYIVRNSWSESWGMQGYFTLPEQYLGQYGSDFWVIKQVS